MKLLGLGISPAVSENMFSRIDLNYLIQESYDNDQSEKDMENEVKIFQNALDFRKLDFATVQFPVPKS